MEDEGVGARVIHLQRRTDEEEAETDGSENAPKKDRPVRLIVGAEDLQQTRDRHDRRLARIPMELRTNNKRMPSSERAGRSLVSRRNHSNKSYLLIAW